MYLLLYLLLLSIFLTFTFTLVFKNRGPWNNPMLFFVVHFLVSWSVLLWSGPVNINGNTYPFITGSAIAIIIASLLAATKVRKGEQERIRTLKDQKVVEVLTQGKDNPYRIMPSRYFWGLLLLLTLIILTAYLLKFIQ